ncbi:LacI family DNA-binding transcriptional regulator [Sunxiuqinia dokdonensis]|uniref:LacI family transcription regulator n=1 Tax=Sunxiuqinia dokdonensis TaxID=1409788 RepID=A0A0L8V2G1_9BACT|nr:substrate-binding domain-containing protein [Sunxiuqinia dokdonensis]KOH42660.1 LacI family transcription regulator [Sunxiuqinia dokdonensis]
MSKKVSLKDIATKVGVSTATVSYVLNGLEKEKRVGVEVAKKIKDAARELNYMPNQIARSLRKGSTNTIGLIVADIANPFFGQLARIVEDEAIKHNYTVIFGSSDEDCVKSEALIDTFVNRQVDGFIIAPSEGCKSQINALINREVPLVLIDRYLPQLNTSYVVLDNFTAVYDAVTHLVEKGHRRIGMVAYENSLIHMSERIRGYKEAMIDHQLEKEIRIKKIAYNLPRQEMEKIIGEMLTHLISDALIFATNALSLAGLYAVKTNQKKVPEELALIGFDGNEAFDFFDSPLTYIKQPLEQMGRESVRILLDEMKGNTENQHIQMASKLITRASCG